MYDSVVSLNKCCVCGLGGEVIYIDYDSPELMKDLETNKKLDYMFKRMGQLYTCTGCKRSFHKECMPQGCQDCKSEY